MGTAAAGHVFVECLGGIEGYESVFALDEAGWDQWRLVVVLRLVGVVFSWARLGFGGLLSVRAGHRLTVDSERTWGLQRRYRIRYENNKKTHDDSKLTWNGTLPIVWSLASP